jgi:hypothetical protein
MHQKRYSNNAYPLGCVGCIVSQILSYEAGRDGSNKFDLGLAKLNEDLRAFDHIFIKKT